VGTHEQHRPHDDIFVDLDEGGWGAAGDHVVDAAERRRGEQRLALPTAADGLLGRDPVEPAPTCRDARRAVRSLTNGRPNSSALLKALETLGRRRGRWVVALLIVVSVVTLARGETVTPRALGPAAAPPVDAPTVQERDSVPEPSASRRPRHRPRPTRAHHLDRRRVGSGARRAVDGGPSARQPVAAPPPAAAERRAPMQSAPQPRQTPSAAAPAMPPVDTFSSEFTP